MRMLTMLTLLAFAACAPCRSYAGPSADQIALARCGAEPIKKDAAQEYLDSVSAARRQYGFPASTETVAEVRANPSEMRIGESAWRKRWAQWNVCYTTAKAEADTTLLDQSRSADNTFISPAPIYTPPPTPTFSTPGPVDMMGRHSPPPPAPTPNALDNMRPYYSPPTRPLQTPAERLLSCGQDHDCRGVGGQ